MVEDVSFTDGTKQNKGTKVIHAIYSMGRRMRNIREKIAWSSRQNDG